MMESTLRRIEILEDEVKELKEQVRKMELTDVQILADMRNIDSNVTSMKTEIVSVVEGHNTKLFKLIGSLIVVIMILIGVSFDSEVLVNLFR